MANWLNIGVNLDMRVLQGIVALNAACQGDAQVREVYGADRGHAALTARPAFRLPDTSPREFEDFVRTAREEDIEFNFAMNSPAPFGSYDGLVAHEAEIVECVRWLEDIGVSRVTVSHPALMEIIRRRANSSIEIEASTIMHLEAVTQIRYLYETYGVRKICCSLSKNRDFSFLRAASNYCQRNGVTLEVLANEFCGVGGAGYATPCVYRDSCYLCHATNRLFEDTCALDGYPMDRCAQTRAHDAAMWLKLNFIRPEDLRVYNEIGIDHFKITGRTGTTGLILRVARAYLEESFDGNLLHLWKPVESIGDDGSETDVAFCLPNKALDGFVDHWSRDGHLCANESCGETCRYCDGFYERVIR